MIENRIRPAYQKILVDPLVKKLSPKISPNIITGLSTFIGILVFPLVILEAHWLAVSALLISGYLDTLDGSVARHRKKSASHGTVLDILSDRIVESVVILSLFVVDPVHRALPALMMALSCYLCITSFLVVGIFTKNESEKGFHYSSGIMERAEAFIFFTAMILIPTFFTPLAFLFSALVLLTSYLRVRQFLKNVP